MRVTRLLASTVVVALAALSVGAATAWFSDSETIRYEITAADSFEGPKVWVCKLIGPPDDPAVKPGKNPIHVSIDSVDAQEGFSDAHPSYVVDHGDVVCEVPAADRGVIETPDIAPRTEPGTITDPTGQPPDDPGVTTSTTTHTVTETVPTTSSTTTTMASDPTTTTTITTTTTTTTTPAATTGTTGTTPTTVDPAG